MHNWNQMSNNDGYEMWRKSEEHALDMLVQNRLNFVQNPIHCEKAKQLVCSKLDGDCDFGKLFFLSPFSDS
jgi:hypothetical protein